MILLLFLAVSGEAEFYRGLELERAGQYAEAVRVLEAIPKEDPFADDALLEIGRVEEEKLDDPGAALAAYERLLRDHPDSRLAARAQRRVEELRKLGPTARAWLELVHADVPLAERIVRLDRFVAAHPDLPAAALWLATLLRDAGRERDAEIRARDVIARWPDSPEAARARTLIDELRRTQAWAERRARLTVVAWLVLAGAALAAAFAARGLRPLVRPPVELFYLLPVAALFVGAALTENGALGHAVEIICAGGLAVAWLSGAALEAARARGPVRLRRALAHAAVSALAVVAICYIAVTRERLVDQILETIRYGADR